MKHLNCFTSVGAIFLFTVLVSAMHAAPPQYAVTVLDNLSNGINSHGYGINSSGQVAGTDGARHAVQWTGMTPTNLLTLGGTFTLNYGINISGQMVGYGDITGNSAHHAIRWTGTTPTDLGTLGGTFSFASGINDSGQVAGYANITGNTANHAVRWTGTMPTDLGILPGGTLSQIGRAHV